MPHLLQNKLHVMTEIIGRGLAQCLAELSYTDDLKFLAMGKPRHVARVHEADRASGSVEGRSRSFRRTSKHANGDTLSYLTP